jgi:hypothetical protein
MGFSGELNGACTRGGSPIIRYVGWNILDPAHGRSRSDGLVQPVNSKRWVEPYLNNVIDAMQQVESRTVAL